MVEVVENVKWLRGSSIVVIPHIWQRLAFGFGYVCFDLSLCSVYLIYKLFNFLVFNIFYTVVYLGTLLLILEICFSYNYVIFINSRAQGAQE